MSDDEKKNVLNLDELFGQAMAVKVITDEREYQLRPPEALGPRDLVRVQYLRRTVNHMNMLDDLNEKQEQALVEILDELLTILCDEFPVAKMDFGKKLRTLNFYTEETTKNALRALLQQRTGVTPSAN